MSGAKRSSSVLRRLHLWALVRMRMEQSCKARDWTKVLVPMPDVIDKITPSTTPLEEVKKTTIFRG